MLLRKAKDSALPMNLSLGGFACQRYQAAGEPVLWCLHDEDRFCQVSRHRPWLTRIGLGIWPALTAGWMGCGA